MIKELFRKYKKLVMYAVFGILTTLLNMLSYHISFNIIKMPNILSTIIAWLLAVIFAFITNKLWVFDSKSFDKLTLRHEIIAFLGARAGTGILDVGIMFLAVDVMNLNSTVWKFISNIIVIALNYIASKLLIFKKKIQNP